MPLDANKSAHIQAVTLRSFQGRQKTVIFVTQNNGGSSYTYIAVQVIMRSHVVIDPEIPTLFGTSPRQVFDTLLVVPITANFAGVVMVADTAIATAAGVATAPKYEIVEMKPVGIVLGGSRYVAELRRFR